MCERVLFGDCGGVSAWPVDDKDAVNVAYLNDNRIRDWPSKWPRKLIELYLRGNRLETPPSSLPAAIQVLDLRGNGLSRWLNVDECEDQSGHTTLTTLRLADNDLWRVDVSAWKALRVLDLSGNRLREVPSRLAALPHLREIDLSRNELRELSDDALNNCAGLEEVNLRGNRLRRLPRSLTSLRSLRRLDVSENDLEELPTCKFVTRPRILCLHNERLTWLPVHLAWNNFFESSSPTSAPLPVVHLECFGCFKRNSRANVKLTIKDGDVCSHHLAHLPLTNQPDRPPRLEELCKRSVHRNARRGAWLRFLPPKVQADFLRGPGFHCDFCDEPIFDDYVSAAAGVKVDDDPADINRRDGDLPLAPALAIFCSLTCSQRARTEGRSLSSALKAVIAIERDSQ